MVYGLVDFEWGCRLASAAGVHCESKTTLRTNELSLKKREFDNMKIGPIRRNAEDKP